MSLDARLLVWAVVAQVLLTFIVFVIMAALRQRDLRAGLEIQSIALREQKWSTRTTQAAYSFSNQFEIPVLFYVVAILFLIAARPDLVVVVLAWLFVVTRVIHAWIHTTSNIVRARAAAYGIGVVAVLLMWIWFIVRFAAVSSV